MSSRLANIEHFVVMVFENRSFDHVLGFLYEAEGNVSSRGHRFDGLTGKEWNKDKDGNKVIVRKLEKSDSYCYFTPRADPGEGFTHTSGQLYQNHLTVNPTERPCNRGFVTDYQDAVKQERKEHWTIYPGESTNSPIRTINTTIGESTSKPAKKPCNGRRIAGSVIAAIETASTEYPRTPLGAAVKEAAFPCFVWARGALKP